MLFSSIPATVTRWLYGELAALINLGNQHPRSKVTGVQITLAVTSCANSYGRPWTESGFRASWRKVRKKLEEEARVGAGLTLYGLRHTVAVILRECGCDERTIADAYRDGPPLCQGCGPEAEDAERGEQLRCRCEQTAHKDCQTNLKKCQTAI
jgi:hypothetical protein